MTRHVGDVMTSAPVAVEPRNSVAVVVDEGQHAVGIVSSATWPSSVTPSRLSATSAPRGPTSDAARPRDPPSGSGHPTECHPTECHPTEYRHQQLSPEGSVRHDDS